MIQTDNMPVMFYINKLEEQNLRCWDLCQWCFLHKIQMKTEYIPGVNNVLADNLARLVYCQTEWELNEQIFNQLTLIWGEPQVDLFVTYKKKKSQSYALRFHIQKL